MNNRQQNQFNVCAVILAEKGFHLFSLYVNCTTPMNIQCNFGHIFTATSTVIKKGVTCPFCSIKKTTPKKKKIVKISEGERQCGQILAELGLSYETQYRIASLPRRKYDFHFIYADKHYLLEFDGAQHFQYTAIFHRSKASFLRRQAIDRLKTWSAVEAGYYIIRIDYSAQKYLRENIICALEQNKQIYLSDLQKYQYLFTNHKR